MVGVWQLVGDVWNCSGVLGVGAYVPGVDRRGNMGVLVREEHLFQVYMMINFDMMLIFKLMLLITAREVRSKRVTM